MNVGGIVAGVVVGVVALLAIAGGLAFWWRRRVNREIEEEHRRNAAVNAFMKPPGSSGGYSLENDTRLDPVMAQRRLSSGSIADNQDYSRRILRVCLAPNINGIALFANQRCLGHERMRSINCLRRTTPACTLLFYRHLRRFGILLASPIGRCIRRLCGISSWCLQ